MTNGICDLPHDLVGDKIFSKVPITSLRQVRSTCKLWDGLSRDWVLGKAAVRQHQFLGFITVDDKVCSLRFRLGRKEEDSVGIDLSIKNVDIFNQVEISKVIHCDGLLLCVASDNSKLVAWNPYLGQTRSISPITYFHLLDCYLFGYDRNRNHKILRFVDTYCFRKHKHLFGFEIYNFRSQSWRVLDITPDWKVVSGCRGVSLKGNTYFWAHEKSKRLGRIYECDWKEFLLCFDFTTERFGQRLPVPIHSFYERTVALSSVRDEKLALLHQKSMNANSTIDALEIWITTKIEANDVSWSKFIDVDMRPLIGDRLVRFRETHGSFFIDEEEKVAVVFDMDGFEETKTAHYHTAFIIGDDGRYYRTVNLGEAPMWEPPYPGYTGYTPHSYSPPLVCSSSYLPSLVQLNQRDEC